MDKERFSPQLVMILEGLSNLPDMELPEGYTVRSAKEGDEQSWVDIINDSFGYSAQRSFDGLKGEACFSYDRVFFICHNGIPVGTASSWYRKDWPEDTGYLHMVGVKGGHVGKRLGALVSLEAIKDMRNRGFRACVLQTDDFRIPAIKTYLRLGFLPKYTHENHPGRWENIMKEINQ